MSSSSYCSVFSLCVAAIATLVSVAFVGIAFSTDNWLNITVDRDNIQEFAETTSGNKNLMWKLRLKSDIRYFDRVRGIFRVCFPHEEKPEPRRVPDDVPPPPLNILIQQDVNKNENNGNQQPLTSTTDRRLPNPSLYLNPVDEWCTNIDYYMQLIDLGLLPPNLTHNGQIWFHFARTSVACFCLFFMFSAIACVTGLMGCWKASGDHLISTASLMLMAALSAAAGMGFWHGANFYEIERVRDERLEFFLTWPDILRANTSFSIGWSYIVAWIGIGVAFMSSLSFSFAAICIRSELKSIRMKAERMFNMHAANQAVCQHPQLYHPQFLRPASAYGGSTMSLNLSSMNSMNPHLMTDEQGHPMPPMPMHHAPGTISQFGTLSKSSGTYFSVGYPVNQHPLYNDNTLNYSINDDARKIKYKNVVKELEDSKV